MGSSLFKVNREAILKEQTSKYKKLNPKNNTVRNPSEGKKRVMHKSISN